MFFDKSGDSRILEKLARVYDQLESKEVNWKYHLAGAGETSLIDGCIEDSSFLEKIGAKIGRGLAADNKDPDNKNAKKASLLFERLYHKGFDKELYKTDIQKNFQEILPKKTIERLNNGSSMSDCLTAMAVVVEERMKRT
jgi:hypothetical protein